MSIKLQLV